MNRADIPVDAPINQITDWPSFFDQIRHRPGMWLGLASLTALQHFINGIKLAEYLYDVPEEKCLAGFDFEDFERWFAESYKRKSATSISFSLVRGATDSEEAAFFEWMAWYDRFRRERADA